MKAAIVTAAGKTPIYADFEKPVAKEGEQLIAVRASALSNLTKSRASGAHYSATGIYPAIAGTDGVGITPDGRRVYFAMPEAPFGSMAEFCPSNTRRLVDIPDSLDDVTAAAIANPGMSAWASLVERANLVTGETVLINGATGAAGRVAVQLAKYLGAAKVIVTGRNAVELEHLKNIGADVAIPFTLPSEAEDFEKALKDAFTSGIDIVIDYLWGDSAKTILSALAKTIGDCPARFIQVGTAGGEAEIALAGTALRSSAIVLMGSGIGSVGRGALLQSIKSVFEAVGPAKIQVATSVVPLCDVEKTWEKASGQPRLVYTIS
jgi:NADPH:quinone reductase-like Zn-dependent oxidoreductase